MPHGRLFPVGDLDPQNSSLGSISNSTSFGPTAFEGSHLRLTDRHTDTQANNATCATIGCTLSYTLRCGLKSYFRLNQFSITYFHASLLQDIVSMIAERAITSKTISSFTVEMFTSIITMQISQLSSELL